MGFGPFNWRARKLILQRLLETQQIMGYELITLDELKAIDEIWDQELDLSRRVLVELYEEITGEKLPWYDYKEPLVDSEDQKDFFRIVKAGFSAKRKKLRSSLSGGLGVSKASAEQLLKKANISPDVRAEDLAIDDWQRLLAVQKNIKHNEGKYNEQSN